VVQRDGLPQDATALRRLKALGFADRQLAQLAGVAETEVYALRGRLGVQPVYKRIDTCAAEFTSATPYMYSTYEGGFGTPVCEAEPTERDKIIILGGGPNRIGQGIEFDYCCVHAAYALKEAGFETIMVNCNPEPSAPTTTPPIGCISSR
jgi:carbamoyl-phosphate synthase large subunit